MITRPVHRPLAPRERRRARGRLEAQPQVSMLVDAPSASITPGSLVDPNASDTTTFTRFDSETWNLVRGEYHDEGNSKVYGAVMDMMKTASEAHLDGNTQVFHSPCAVAKSIGKLGGSPVRTRSQS